MLAGMRAALALVLLLAAPTAASGDGPTGPVCTLVGCHSGVTVQFGRPLTAGEKVTLCMNNTCRAAHAVGAGALTAWKRGSETRPVTVRVIVRRGGHVVFRRTIQNVRLARFQPNGPDCPPLCWQASFELSARHGLLALIRHST
jgi:hypothetical protein